MRCNIVGCHEIGVERDEIEGSEGEDGRSKFEHLEVDLFEADAPLLQIGGHCRTDFKEKLL